MASGKPTESLSPTTLFVRGIPPTCSNETLSEVFSKAGAIKDCFVVKYKDSQPNPDRPCIGYVTYSTPEEARNAQRMEKEFSIDNNKLKISFARKKKNSKKKGKKQTPETAENSPQKIENEDETGKENTKKLETKPVDLKAEAVNFEDTFTVLVSGLPALYKKEHVMTMWKKCGLKEPKELIFPCESLDEETEEPEKTENNEEAKNLRQNAKFIVDTKQAALKAYNKLAGKLVGKKKNYALIVNFLTPEGNFKAARKSRLIIRNVSFQCSEDDLKKAFSSFGNITEVKIPTKPDGKKRGFAFVQFSHVFEATRAIKAMNMQEIRGRKVAIDWSLPKEKYREMNSEGAEGEQEKETDTNVESTPAQNSVGEEDAGIVSDDQDTSSESGLKEDGSESKKETRNEVESESDKETSEEEESEDEEESDNEEDEEENPYSKPLRKASRKPVKKLNPKASYDVHEGRTVFILNLSYDTKEDQLAEVLKEYGELCYTKIVINHETGMPKGCAFAQFKNAEQAKSCIDALGSDNSGKILDDREIKVVKALSRGETDKMRKEGKKKKEKEDKRNLYLGREGLIRPGTLAAEGLSQIELKKRVNIENAKRSKLKNLNVFVSTTRLCIHNLPKAVDDAKLRELMLKQFKDRKAVRITECRIMRDRNVVNEQGVARPLGFAFVDFAQHKNALIALRSFNNNPDIFGPIKRPVVEFALENKKAIEIKEQRKSRYLAKQKLRRSIRNTDGDQQNVVQKPKKIGRRQRQVMKRRMENGEKAENQGKLGKTEEKTDSGTLSKKKGQKKKKFKPNIKPKMTNSGEKSTSEEQKPFQGSSGMTRSGKKLPLPTHSRPKIRTKNKRKILEQMRRSKKLNSKSEQRKIMGKFERERDGNKERDFQKQSTKNDGSRLKAPKRKRNSGEDADFNALVAKYTKTFMDKTAKARKNGDKWYES